jgi:hypothetical protein
LKLLDFCSKITGEIISQSFFSNDIENIVINGKPIEVGITELFSDLIDLRRSLFYNLKEMLFGTNFADKYLNKNEQKIMDIHKKYENLLNDLIQKRIELRKTKKS